MELINTYVETFSRHGLFTSWLSYIYTYIYIHSTSDYLCETSVNINLAINEDNDRNKTCLLKQKDEVGVDVHSWLLVWVEFMDWWLSLLEWLKKIQ